MVSASYVPPLLSLSLLSLSLLCRGCASKLKTPAEEMFRKSYERSLRLSLRDHTIVQSSLGRGMEAMEEEGSAEWQATILGLVASTGLEACQVERMDELKDCVALCALSEELMVQQDLITTEELCELRAHDNIKLPERLKLYLEVFETDAGWVPFVDCDKTVESSKFLWDPYWPR